ncbi:MAG: DNA-processing protein DprA [Peptoniphilaceae bacterium]
MKYPSKTLPLSFRFPLRNRIISGLGDIVIVVEAMGRIGSLITARLATEQGKGIFAVPGNINFIYSKGTNLLIRNRARIFTSMDDLIAINLKEDISFINSIVTILELKNIVKSTGYKVNIKI